MTSDQRASPATTELGGSSLVSGPCPLLESELSSTTITRGRGPPIAGPCVQSRHELGGHDHRLDTTGRQDTGGASGRPSRVYRNIRRSRAQDPVDRRNGLKALGQPEAHTVATVDAPAHQPRRQPIRVAHELGKVWDRPCSSSTAVWSGRRAAASSSNSLKWFPSMSLCPSSSFPFRPSLISNHGLSPAEPFLAARNSWCLPASASESSAVCSGLTGAGVLASRS